MPCATRALDDQQTDGSFLGTNALLSTAHRSCSTRRLHTYRQLEVPMTMVQFDEFRDSLHRPLTSDPQHFVLDER